MLLTRRGNAIVLLVALCLVAWLVIDLSRMVKPSAVSAAACTADLVAAWPDPAAIVDRYHDTITAEASRRDLPPELVAAVIINHQRYLSRFRRFTDCFGSALGANLSLGLAQLRLSTAAQLDGILFERVTASEFRELRARLLDPKLNIAYEAKELRALLERPGRYPGIGADELINDPFAMALVITEYRMGRLPTPSEQSRLSAEAFNGLRVIQDETLDLFARDPEEVRTIRRDIGNYLDYIYCESGIFNVSVCDKSRHAPAIEASQRRDGNP
jgi:hypothetical protein